MSSSPTSRWPAGRGALLALTAAVLFGASTPLVQRFGAGVGAFTTAALLYAGAALAGALSRQPIEREARVTRGDFPRLLAMAAAGAVVGPVALAWGLQRTSGTSASLMLALEAVFTAVLAWCFYRERMNRRVWLAMMLLIVGGFVLILDQSRDSDARLVGLLAVLAATVAWGLDNTLSRALAERDPGQVVVAKAMLGAAATSLLAWVLRRVVAEQVRHVGAIRGGCDRVWPEPALLSVGATGFRGRAHGFGVRLRPVCRRGIRRRARRSLDELDDGRRRRADARRRGVASRGIACPRARSQCDRARARARTRRRTPRSCS